jgi:hypothetical protein
MKRFLFLKTALQWHYLPTCLFKECRGSRKIVVPWTRSCVFHVLGSIRLVFKVISTVTLILKFRLPLLKETSSLNPWPLVKQPLRWRMKTQCFWSFRLTVIIRCWANLLGIISTDYRIEPGSFWLAPWGMLFTALDTSHIRGWANFPVLFFLILANFQVIIYHV